MQVTQTIPQLRQQIRSWRNNGQSIALVPTMGNLHAGHLSLIAQARQHANRVVATIFVNPTQFGPNDDYASYPRTLETDIEQLKSHNTDLLFAPQADEIYPANAPQALVQLPAINHQLEGHHRPGHLDGVATVVSKLFNITQPDIAIFGKKDYQQLLLIRQLTRALNFPIDIIGAETQREPDGLAMSSRNQYLTPAQRKLAPELHNTLQWVRTQLRNSPDRTHPDLEASARKHLDSRGFTTDYIAIRDRNTLAPPAPNSAFGQLVVLAAAWLGKARLIDNLEVEPINTRPVT